MRIVRSFAGLAVVAALGSLGCSSASSTPTSSDYDDVAQSTAALVVNASGGGDIGSMSASASLAVGITPGDVTIDASGTYGAVNAGLNYSYAVSCTAASGAALSKCGPTTNDAQANVSWSGDLTLPGLTATVGRQGSWTLSGVQTGTVTFDGSGSFTFAAQFQSLFRNESASVKLSYDASYDAITFVAALEHPTGGSVHYTVNASGDASGANGQGAANFSIDAVLVFNADGSATLTLDGSHVYSVSATGVVIKI
jgi:hypothetical protein